jgi:hypothetical protein
MLARRNKNEGLFDLLLLLPWWVTLIVGIGLWFYLRRLTMPVSSFVPKEIVTWIVLQCLKRGCLGAALVSEIGTFRRQLHSASAEDIDAIRAMSWREFNQQQDLLFQTAAGFVEGLEDRTNSGVGCGAKAF